MPMLRRLRRIRVPLRVQMRVGQRMQRQRRRMRERRPMTFRPVHSSPHSCQDDESTRVKEERHRGVPRDACGFLNLWRPDVERIGTVCVLRYRLRGGLGAGS